jgi:hypothetical protein
MNAPRVYDKDSWEDFIKYSRGVITAHVIYGKSVNDCKWEWDTNHNNPEELEWVKQCRAKVLTYPDRNDNYYAYIINHIPWIKHIEHWAWTAGDVTHINADLAQYEKRNDLPDRDTMNELLYVLKNGTKLSDKYTPESIRKGLSEGKVPGDRISYIAGKMENTKYPGNQRETHSADDISREIYTEFDINISRISSIVMGVAMRASKTQLEKS